MYVMLFTSPSCAPCKTMKPRVINLCEEENVDLLISDIVELPNDITKYMLRSVPTTILFDSEDKEITRFIGIAAEETLREIFVSYRGV